MNQMFETWTWIQKSEKGVSSTNSNHTTNSMKLPINFWDTSVSYRLTPLVLSCQQQAVLVPNWLQLISPLKSLCATVEVHRRGSCFRALCYDTIVLSWLVGDGSQQKCCHEHSSVWEQLTCSNYTDSIGSLLLRSDSIVLACSSQWLLTWNLMLLAIIYIKKPAH